MATGRVKWYRFQLGRGVITPDDHSADVRFNRSVVVGNDAALTENLSVDYDAVPGPLGDGPVATRVAIR